MALKPNYRTSQLLQLTHKEAWTFSISTWRLGSSRCDVRTYVEEPDILLRRPPAFSMLLSSLCSRASPRCSLLLPLLMALRDGHMAKRLPLSTTTRCDHVSCHFGDETDGLWWYPVALYISVSFSASALWSTLCYAVKGNTLMVLGVINCVKFRKFSSTFSNYFLCTRIILGFCKYFQLRYSIETAKYSTKTRLFRDFRGHRSRKSGSFFTKIR